MYALLLLQRKDNEPRKVFLNRWRGNLVLGAMGQQEAKLMGTGEKLCIYLDCSHWVGATYQ